MKRLYISLIALLTVACGSKPAATTSVAESKPVTVSTAPAQSREVPADFEETGTFTADEASNIAPPVAGRVISTPVDVGAQVKAGQIICELDHRDAELRLQQVRAQMQESEAGVRQARNRIGLQDGQFDAKKVPEVAAAQANYQSAEAQAKMAAADAQRYANLVATGDVSRSAYEKARTAQETAEAQANAARQQYEAAANSARQQFEILSSSQASSDGMKAQMAQAEKALADTTIRAPFDGFITARPVAAGEYVALADKIATVVRIGSLKLELQTPEQRAALAHIGDAVAARVSAYPDRDFTGRVSAINQSVDPNSRVFILIARFDNPKAELKPGMFATARVRLPGATQGIFIPRAVVIRDKTTDSNQVFVIQNGRARLRVVSLGDAEGDTVRVLTGIVAGDIVATSNQVDLYDGAAVRTK